MTTARIAAPIRRAVEPWVLGCTREGTMNDKLSIATFNCENLFDRAKVLNIDNEAITAELLGSLGHLQAELRKTTYDKGRIWDLYSDLKDYVDLVETRGFLLNTERNAVSANGRGAWEGWLALKAGEISDAARVSTAKVIQELDADIVCLVETDSRPFLKKFVEQKLGGVAAYPHIMLIDGNDERGIDVGVISKWPIKAVRSHIDDRRAAPLAEKRLFSRDCLEVLVEHDKLGEIWLLVNHLKSKRDSDPEEKKLADQLRTEQAERIAAIVREHDLAKENVVVLGDFNDTRDSAPLASLYGATAPLRDVMVIGNVDEKERWTYWFHGSGQQIDHMFLSETMAARLETVRVERRGIYGIDTITQGQTKPFPEVTSRKSAASDHAAIVATFRAT
jgi:endonuclease/exonuclease/phosphatase family metal-dependent hydrolase